jgi:hypothetical protein
VSADRTKKRWRDCVGCVALPLQSQLITMTMKVPIDRDEEFAVRPVPHSQEWLEAIRASGERGWQLYRKMGSPKNILAPMVDQSETVSTSSREHYM